MALIASNLLTPAPAREGPTLCDGPVRRLVLVVGYEPWLLPPVVELAQEFLSRGVTVAICYLGVPDGGGEMAGLPHTRVARPAGTARVLAALALTRSLRHLRAASTPDVLIACDPLALQATRMACFPRSTLIGYWSLEMSVSPEGIPRTLSQFRSARLGKWLNDVQFALAPSESRLAHLLERTRGLVPGLVILNAKRAIAAGGSPPAGYVAHPVSQLPVRLVYTGRMSPTHNIRELVEALTFLPPSVGLVLAGSSESTHRLEVTRVVNQEGLGSRCLLLDRLPRVAVDALVSHCQIGAVLYSSDRSDEASDPAPNKVGDYAAHGLAMLGTSQPYLRYWLDERGTGRTVDSPNPQAIAEAASGMLDSAVLDRLRSASRKIFTDEMNMRVQSDRLSSFVAGLAASPSRRV